MKKILLLLIICIACSESNVEPIPVEPFDVHHFVGYCDSCYVDYEDVHIGIKVDESFSDSIVVDTQIESLILRCFGDSCLVVIDGIDSMTDDHEVRYWRNY